MESTARPSTASTATVSYRVREYQILGLRRDVDRLGREGFRKMGLPLAMVAVPGLAAQFREVPGEFWVADVDDEGVAVACICCPCGEVHDAEVALLTPTACERFFYYLGDTLLVAGSPRPNAETPAPS